MKQTLKNQFIWKKKMVTTRLGTNRKFPNLEPLEPSIIEPRATRTYVQNLFPNLEPSIPNLEPLNGRAGSKIRHTDHGF